MKSLVILDKNGGIATSLNKVLDNNFFSIYLIKKLEEIDQLLKYENVEIILVLCIFEEERLLTGFIKKYNYPYPFALIPTNSIIYSKLKKIKDLSLFDIQKPNKELNEELIDFIIDLGYSDTAQLSGNEKILNQLRENLLLS